MPHITKLLYCFGIEVRQSGVSAYLCRKVCDRFIKDTLEHVWGHGYEGSTGPHQVSAFVMDWNADWARRYIKDDYATIRVP